MTEFSELGLSPETLKAVADSGYTTATPIQAEAIPIALSGRDVLGIAQTGTGKTAAFTLPMIEKLASGRSKARMPRSLVVAPTRELADQVAASFEKYAKGTKLTWALLIGGVSFGDQEKKLDRGVDVLIATPGRLLDHFERGKLLMTGVQIMVVDEADRMLDMGFIPDIERIFKLTPPKKQTLFFSATMPPEITRLTKQFLNDPVRIEASRPATTAENIAQHLVRIPLSDPKAKRMALRALIDGAEIKNGIVFCNRKSEVDVVAKSLRAHGHDAAAIHGDLDQSVRTKTLEGFRRGELKLLVASDVAARGLDIPDVSHVFNFDVPHHADDYVHRIGRTGRAGRSGDTFMIVTPADSRNLDKVLKLIGKVPSETVLDLDWSQAAGGDERRGGGSRSSRERPAGREGGGARSRSRERPRPETPVEQPDVVEAVAAAAVSEAPVREAPAREERAPRRARSSNRPARLDDRPARVEDSPARSEDRPARSDDRPARLDGRPVRSEERPARSEERPARRAPEPARRDREEREESGVRGFGDDTPAFLLRPIPKMAEAKS
ncbi:MAG TPA: DEAD/DEAH box helicase [Caulobacteraceae bacterium]|jgi:superfamily II DNA/RNA helicase